MYHTQYSISGTWRHILHRRPEQQHHVLGRELVALPVGDGRDGILGPARVDACDAESLAACNVAPVAAPQEL